MSDDRNPIRILAVDDHPLLRQGVASLIADEPDMTLVAKAANGREAIEQFRRHRPDITLMDVQMPEMNGSDRKANLVFRWEIFKPAQSPKFCRPRERCLESKHFREDHRAKRESSHHCNSA